MAEESTAWKDVTLGRLEGTRWERYIRLLTTPRGISIGVTVLIFLVAAVVYHFTSVEGGSPYNAPVRLANAFLHGKLYVPEGKDVPYMDWAIHEGRYYPIEPPAPTFVVLPGVAILGPGISQTLVTVVLGAITASAVYQLLRKLTEKVSVQIWLTVLFAFGTTFWFYASRGDQTDIGHVVGVLFTVAALYATLVVRQPFLAGLFLGMAYMSRLTMVLALPFFIIMFSDQWLPTRQEGRPVWRRVNLWPLVQLGIGVGIFVVLGALYNYARFGTIWDEGYKIFTSQVPQLAERPLFDTDNIPGHLVAMFALLPRFQTDPSFVMPALQGMAIWATTPPFLYTLFFGLRDRRIAALAWALMLFGFLVALSLAKDMPGFISGLYEEFPRGVNLRGWWELYPFVIMVALALVAGLVNRDKLVVACWAAIIPLAVIHVLWIHVPPQFGYRFALDYYPFLLLLTYRAIGDRVRWHHMALITLAVMINFWGVLWSHQFRLHHFLGWDWLRL